VYKLPTLIVANLAVCSFQAAGADFVSPRTDADKIANAASAGPVAVGRDATVIDIDAKGDLRTLRKGTNRWTCISDIPWSPGNDPECVDENGWAWTLAYLKQETPPAGKVGFGYMLQGGADPSNTDPFAMEPAHGMPWIMTPPHVMIFNYGQLPADYPQVLLGEKPDTSRPWIMWAGTPYAHSMIPVQ
jgi:hypothetical protein